MNLQYLCAEEQDIPVIFDQAKALIDAYEDLSAIDYDKVISWVYQKIQGNISGYTCVLLDGVKCAYFCLCQDGELDDLYVLPDFRGRGIGSQILQHCIARLSQPLYLYVFARNTRAMALYQRFGFEITQTVSNTRYIMGRNG